MPVRYFYIDIKGSTSSRNMTWGDPPEEDCYSYENFKAKVNKKRKILSNLALIIG